MKPGRGKTMAGGAVILGVTTLLATGYAFRGTLVEETWIWQLGSGDESKREAAAAWLAEHDSARAVPVLLKQAGRDPFCLEAVQKIGKAAIPGLAEELRRKIRGGFGGLDLETLAASLADLGRSSPEAVGPLIEMLSHSNSHVRYLGAWALERLGPEGVAAVPALIAILQDQDEDVARIAVEALGSIGPGAEEATPALFDLVKADDSMSQAKEALIAIGEGAAPFLASRLGDQAVRAAAADVLEYMGPAARPALVETLKHRDPQVRLIAAGILSSSQVEAGATVPVLLDVLESGGREAWYQVVAALARYRWEAVPFLVDALRMKTGKTRAGAAEALGWIGPWAMDRPTAPEEASGDASAPAQRGPGISVAVGGLLEALKDEEPEVRSSVVMALGNLGPAAKPAIPELKKLLAAAPPELQELARDALANIENN